MKAGMLRDPIYGAPVYGAPVYGAPVYGAPVYGAPVYGELRDDGKTRPTIAFEVKLLCAATVLLSWPVSICYFLYLKPSVRYWFGYFELFLGGGILLWILGMFFISMWKPVSRGMATVLVLLVPCAAFAISWQLQDLHFRFTAAALISTDCGADASKAYIQKAWTVAKNTSTNCDNYLTELTGAPLDQLSKVRRIENCPGYLEDMAEYEKEWIYLEALETKYQCGGWCYPDYPLWTSSKTPLDSCALAAGSAMGRSIQHMGTQVSVFAVAIFISVSLWLLFAPKPAHEELAYNVF